MSTKIPYGRQDISQTDIEAVIEVLKSDWLTQGPMVPRFEQAVADYCGGTHAVAVNSATSALHIACLALNLGPGDVLWTSPTTFVSTANCALYCGAQTDFVDIDSRSYNMCVEHLAEKLTIAEKDGKLPKVVVPVHLCGQSCDMKAIHALSRQYDFRIIEDASHAIGGKYKDKTIGNNRYSDITVFSFHPVKIITTGEGGMALTNDEELANRMRRYRHHGITTKSELMYTRPDEEIWNYQQLELGFNYRMTDLQAALGLSQMARLDEFVIERHRVAGHYNASFVDLPLIVPWQHPETWSSYHLYPIRVRQSDCDKNQRQIYDALRGAGILANLHYIPVYRQPHYEDMGFEAGYCPEAELYHRETISLPMYPMLTEEQLDYVIETLTKELRI